MVEAFSLPLMQTALMASLLSGQLATYLGVYVLLKRIVFVGMALAQMATLGMALGQLLGLAPVAFALLLSFLAALVLILPSGQRALPREGSIGVAYAAASAFTTLVVAKNPLGEKDMLALIFGNVLGATQSQMVALLVVAAGVFLLQGIFYKEFLLVAFDPETARAMGYRVWVWELLFASSLCLAFAATVRVAGVLVVFSYLVIPAMAALILDLNFPTTLFTAMGLSAIGSFLGVYLSYSWDLPTGASLVAVLSMELLAVGTFRQMALFLGRNQRPKR